MMEVRERQEEAEASGDKATLRELAEWAQARRREHLERIAGLFAKAAGGDAGALKVVRM
jgi:hypothetical protein